MDAIAESALLGELGAPFQAEKIKLTGNAVNPEEPVVRVMRRDVIRGGILDHRRETCMKM